MALPCPALPWTGVTLPWAGVTLPWAGVALPCTGVTFPWTEVTLPWTGMSLPALGYRAVPASDTVLDLRVLSPGGMAFPCHDGISMPSLQSPFLGRAEEPVWVSGCH